MKHKSYGSFTGFLDILFNIITILIFVYIFSILLINDPNSKIADIEMKAEMIITMTWGNIDCDMDIWVRDPSNKIVYFANRESDFVGLERDDRGNINDVVVLNGHTYINPVNVENIIIRKLIPGKYTVNGHVYSCQIAKSSTQPGITVEPIDTIFEIFKLNPSFKVVYGKTISFTKTWEELTVLTFEIDSQHNFKFLNDNFESLVSIKREASIVGRPY